MAGRKAGSLPRLVAPHQPFLDIAGHPPPRWAPGASRRCASRATSSETEDQRNWSDASFKTYSTPLAIPFPAEVAPGPDRAVGHAEPGRTPRVEDDDGRHRSASHPTADDTVTIVVDPAAEAQVPRLGLGLRADAPP
jgi:hypothetical protein